MRAGKPARDQEETARINCSISNFLTACRKCAILNLLYMLVLEACAIDGAPVSAQSIKRKRTIIKHGMDGIPLKHEIELEQLLWQIRKRRDKS